jgi:EmrB/QacA subfamily drug resistance transporter
MSTRRSQSSLVLLLLCVAQFIVAVDFSIVNVALPSIQADLGLGDEALQWVITAFALTFGGLLMLGGRAADLYGRRRMFVAGLWLFAASCLTAGLAQSGAMLLVSRAVQGMAGALIAPAALSLLTTMFREGPERTRALGVYGAVLSGGFVAGMILGGLLTSAAGWRWVMLINVPVAVLAAIAAPVLLRESRGAVGVRRLDLPGALTVSLGIAALVYAISSGEGAGWLSGSTLGVLLASVTLLVLFVVVERRAAQPLVPMEVLGRRSVLAPSVVGVTTFAACGGATFILTLYMQGVLGYTPLQTGLAFCSLGLASMTAGIVAESVARHVGSRSALVGALVVQAAGTVALVGLPSGGVPVLLLAATAIIGFGHVLAVVSFTTLATAGVPAAQQGVVGGLVSTALQIGAALGVAIFGAVALARTAAVDPGPDPSSSALLLGYTWAFAAGVVLLAAGALLALRAVAPDAQRHLGRDQTMRPRPRPADAHRRSLS